MNNQRYILDGKKLVKADLTTWSIWFENSIDKRTVAKTIIGKQEVSTVFLGIDHNWGNRQPLLFETMIFPKAEVYQRYSTWRKAEAGHKKAVRELKALEESTTFTQ